MTEPRAFYNEINDYAADWLETLIQRGLIADGVVDRRSIAEIKPSDLDGFCQVHFFAGLGGWSYALRNAGITDSVPVWTGSCPCQPFSAAGKGGGFDDERHIWPEFYRLIRECRPAIVLGEQVASKDGLTWLDLVQDDMEGTDYAFAAIDSCSAGFGAPHIRQRLYWMAKSLDHPANTRHDDARQYDGGSPSRSARSVEHGIADGMAYADAPKWRADADAPKWRADATGGDNRDRSDAGWSQGASHAEGRGGFVGMADGSIERRGEERPNTGRIAGGDRSEGQPAGFVHGRDVGILEHSVGEGPQGHAGNGNHRNQSGRHHAGADRHAPASGDASDEQADNNNNNRSLSHLQRSGVADVRSDGQLCGSWAGSECGESNGIRHNGAPDMAAGWAGPTNGFWASADWIFCRDGKWRPVEPGSFPLAHGLPRSMGTGGAELRRLAKMAGLDAKSLARAKEYRIGTLSAYGNAINLEQATEFCRAAFAAVLSTH